MNNKIEEFLNIAKITDFVRKQEIAEENKKKILVAVGICAAVLAVALIAFAVYKYLTKDDFEDFDDDFEDDFDDDFEDDFENETAAKETATV